MPTIALSWMFSGWILGCGMLLAFAPASTPFSTLAQLATYLSANNAPDAIAIFDSSMPDYGELRDDIAGLSAQDEVSCAIDVVEDMEQPDGSHRLDVDWFMQITNQLNQKLDRRRERVRLEMKQTRGKWRVTAMDPVKVLEPTTP